MEALKLADILKYARISEVVEGFLSYIEREKDINIAADGIAGVYKELVDTDLETLNALGDESGKSKLTSTHGFNHGEKDTLVALGMEKERTKNSGAHLLKLGKGKITDVENIQAILKDTEATPLEKAYLFQFLLLTLIDRKVDPISALIEGCGLGNHDHGAEGSEADQA